MLDTARRREAGDSTAQFPRMSRGSELGLLSNAQMTPRMMRDLVNATLGFEELKARAAQYPPEKVAKITGIPADDIRKLAREYATTQPSAIREGVALERSPGGGQLSSRIPSDKPWLSSTSLMISSCFIAASIIVILVR